MDRPRPRIETNRWHRPQAATKTELTDFIATNRSLVISPELREQLLAELGFDWNAMADYLVVSKDALRKVSLQAMRGVS